MTFNDMFALAAGSVQGRDHLWAGKNNQDAFCSAACGQSAVLVVCDGCGSGASSEVGAQIGARALTAAIMHAMQTDGFTIDDSDRAGAFLTCMRENLLDALRPLLPRLGSDAAQVVSRYFLFTIV
jgi:hypothetical protein